ncbi:hypothetical protein quinque_014181 [Culex quinquefasciatus]
MTRRKGKPDDRGGTSLNDRTAPEWMDSTGEHDPLTVLLMTPAHREGKLPTNPFTIARSVKEQVGAITAAYRDKDGHLVIKVRNDKKAAKLMELSKLIDGTEVKVTEHAKLNQATCIVTCHTVDELSDEELAEELADQGVIHVHRFGRKGGRSATMSVTFRGTVVPREIHFGFDRCAKREFKQAPMQCYRCYDFGHTKPRCSAEELCRNCSKAHTIEKDSDGKTICSAAPSCKHCNGAHSPTSRMCPKYVEEEEINEIRTKEDKSAREARRLFHERKATSGSSYASAAASGNSDKALTEIASFKQARAAERKQNEENQQALKKAAAQTDGSNLEKTPAKPNSGSELDMEVTEETNKRPRPESQPSEDPDIESAAQTASALALQWNICGLSTRHAELELLIKIHRPHVIALQEVQTKQVRQKLDKGGYDWEFAFPPGEVSKNGAALGIGKDIPHDFLQPDTTLQAVAAKVEWPIQATFVSLYVSKIDGKTTLKDKLQKLLDQLPGPVVFLGDWNAHSDLWGGNTLDERGRAIEDFVSSNQLIVLNNGAHTRVDFHDGHTSAIDLSIVSESLARRLSWEVTEDSGGSDHFPIVIRDMDSRPHCQCRGPIVSAAETSIPRTSTKVCRRAVHWWNQSVETAIRSRKKALRKLRKMKPDDPRKPESLEAFKVARRASRKATKEAKAQSWTAFVTGISPSLNTKEIWRRINTFRNGNRSSIKRLTTPDGVIDSPEEFWRISSTGFTIDHTKHDDYYNQAFSMAELRWAINRGKGLSDGVDRIGYPMLQHLTEPFAELLLSVINEIWSTGEIPARWKEGLVVAIPKANKDPTQPENLRPITLVSCVGKTMERMANRRLVQILESKGVLGEKQHGFRSGHGVDTYLADLEEELHSAINEGKHTELALLDLSKAYDTAWRAPVVASLAKWGIGGNMGRYVENFLSGRTFRVAIGGALSTLRVLENGVPQGTIIAVTAFLIRMTEVEPFIPAGVEVKLYADDILLMTSGKKAMEVRKKAQKAVIAAETWSTLYGFQLSASKSQLLHVCRKNRHSDMPNVCTDDGPMESVKCGTLLGIAFDSRFRFWKHIENTKRSVASRNRALAVLGGHLVAGARTTLLMAQQALVQSKIFFGWGVVSSASSSRRNRLEACYNAGIRSASGAFRSSPIPAIMAEAGVLPFRYQEVIKKGTQVQALAEPGVKRAIFSRAQESETFKTGAKSCSTCGVPLTVAHILLDCRRYEAERNKHELDSNLGVVLSNTDKEEDKLLSFLRESGLFKEL